MTLRVGIISANWGAYAHLPAWRATPGFEVTAICTSRRETAEAAAATHGIARPFWNAGEMIADPDIDVIDCGTRPNIRHAMVLAALRHGKHVYNGIPFAADIDRAREIHDAWLGSKSIAVVDAFAQWIPAHRLAKKMIDEGYLGQPFGGTCRFNISLFNEPNPHFPFNWFWEAGLGVSAMRNLGSHSLHVLVHLFGEIVEVMADDRQLLSEWRFPDGSSIKPETNDFANLTLRFRSGMILQLQVSWSATVGSGWSLEAFGSEGRIVIASTAQFPTSRDTTLHAAKIGSTILEPVEIPSMFLDTPETGLNANAEPQASHPMSLAMLSMKHAIDGNGKAAPDFDQAWTVERILEAARQSAERRTWVEMSDIA
jgi:predicted dehydrogenase